MLRLTLLISIFNIQPFWYQGLRKYQCCTSIECGMVQIRPFCGVIRCQTDWRARVWSIRGTVWFIHDPWPHISINFSNAHYLDYISTYCYATHRVCLFSMCPHVSCQDTVQVPWSEGFICDWYSVWNTLYYWFVIFVLSDAIFRWIMPLLCDMFY